MKKIMTLLAASFLALVSLTTANAQPAQGDVEFTLSGGGSSSNDLDSNAVGANVGLSYFVTDSIEAGVRQGIGYSDAGGSSLIGSTEVALDYNLRLGKFVPFVGVQASATYGDTSLAWNAGPEAGAKFYFREKTFLFAKAAYDFRLDGRAGLGDRDSDRIRYAIGIGVSF